jgi:hypothetical protein
LDYPLRPSSLPSASSNRHGLTDQKQLTCHVRWQSLQKVKRFERGYSKHSEENYGDEEDNWQDDADGTQNWPQNGSRYPQDRTEGGSRCPQDRTEGGSRYS